MVVGDLRLSLSVSATLSGVPYVAISNAGEGQLTLGAPHFPSASCGEAFPITHSYGEEATLEPGESTVLEVEHVATPDMDDHECNLYIPSNDPNEAENGAKVHPVCNLNFSKATSQPARWVLVVPQDSPVRETRDLEGSTSLLQTRLAAASTDVMQRIESVLPEGIVRPNG